MVRYSYIWDYLTTTGGGEDVDGNPIAATQTWVPFECDVQTSAGRFIVGPNGDNINVTYSIFTEINTLGAVKLRDDKGVEYVVLQNHFYRQFEIWV